MTRVAVIGGGVAGFAAAEEASKGGAKVTLLESLKEFAPRKSTWSSVLAGATLDSGARALETLGGMDVEVRLGEPVRALDESGTITTDAGSTRYDRIVLATGTMTRPNVGSGRAKPGLHLLGGLDSFVSLGAEAHRYSAVVIKGGGPLALEIAERLAARGIRVSLLSERGLMADRLDEAPRARLAEAVLAAGVQVVEEKPARTVGVERIEAILVGGRVLPCDAFVVIGDVVPNSLGAGAKLGTSGGILVTAEMTSSWSRLFAAGDCTELSVGATTLAYMTEPAAFLMGKVAGINSAGGRASASVTGSLYRSVFGVEVGLAGLNCREASLAGLNWSDCTLDTGDLTCSLVFDSVSLKLLGVQMVGRGVGRFSESLPLLVSSGLGLEDIAFYDPPGSTDISVIADTAREGLGRLRS